MMTEVSNLGFLFTAEKCRFSPSTEKKTGKLPACKGKPAESQPARTGGSREGDQRQGEPHTCAHARACGSQPAVESSSLQVSLWGHGRGSTDDAVGGHNQHGREGQGGSR